MRTLVNFVIDWIDIEKKTFSCTLNIQRMTFPQKMIWHHLLCSIKRFCRKYSKSMPISVLFGSTNKLELNTFISCNIHRKCFTFNTFSFGLKTGRSWFGKIFFGLHLANKLVMMEILYNKTVVILLRFDPINLINVYNTWVDCWADSSNIHLMTWR